MSIEMQLLVGVALGFVLAGIEMGVLLNWDRIRSFSRSTPIERLLIAQETRI